jgi:hypothetical protein
VSTTQDGEPERGDEGPDGEQPRPTVVLADGDHTLPGLAVRHDVAEVQRSLRGHQAATAVLVLVLLVGLSGWLGVKTTSVGAAAQGVELDVRHAAVSRPGLATPLEVRVRRDGGFDQPVRVAVSARYLAMLDVSGLSPIPASETSRGGRAGWVVWEMDPPDGEVLEVAVDGRVEPARTSTATGTVAVLGAGDEPLVEVDVRTVVLP